jgi:hypothetical protein
MFGCDVGGNGRCSGGGVFGFSTTSVAPSTLAIGAAVDEPVEFFSKGLPGNAVRDLTAPSVSHPLGMVM